MTVDHLKDVQSRSRDAADGDSSGTGLIDVHTHLLPGVDDGCRDYGDSLRCARVLVDSGYTHAFCTPHVWPQLPHNTPTQIAARVVELQGRLDEAGIALRVMPGGEINLLWSWPSLAELKAEDVVTYNLAGQYVLFDFWAQSAAECSECLLAAVEHLCSLGFTPILAHPERVAAVHSDRDVLDRLSDAGVLLQMNTWCLTDPPGTPTHEIAARLLRDGRYFLLGTDLHDPASMPNRIRGLHVAAQLVGQERVRQLTVENPCLLMGAREHRRAAPATLPDRRLVKATDIER